MQRCKAKSKRSGERCKNYAIKEYGVCRMHGAKGGPKTQRGYLICKQAPMIHGLYSKETLQELRKSRSLMKKIGFR
jgi:hypothetical protein